MGYQITIKITYGPTTSDGSFSPQANYSGYVFDVDTLSVQPMAGVWRGALLDNKPPDYWMQTGDVVHWTCNADPANKTAHVWRYDRPSNTCPETDEANSPLCGYVPPETRTCNIEVVRVKVQESNATVETLEAIGPLQFSLDGGLTRQSSPLFEDLDPGTYTVTVYDLGAELPGCKTTESFTIEEPDTDALPATVKPLPIFCFSGNPVVVEVEASRAFRDVVVEVWMEQGHRTNDFKLVYQARRRSDANRALSLDVSDILHAQLEPELEFGVENMGTLTKPIRNWFVRVGDIVPQLGRVLRWSISTNSVVIMGGLSGEALNNGTDYWSTALKTRAFMSWQPRTKLVGPNHRELVQSLIHDDDVLSMCYIYRDAAGQQVGAKFKTYEIPDDPGPRPNIVNPPPPSDAQRVRLVQFVMDVAGAPATTYFAEMVATVGDYDLEGINLEIQRNADREPRQLVYQNSLGGWDTLALFGRLSAKLQVTSTAIDVLQRTRYGNRAVTSHEMSWPPSPPVNTYTVSTGWTSSEWLEYLQELLTPGRQVFEYFNNRLRAVVLSTKELQTYEDDQGHTAATLEYRPSLKTNFYSGYARNTNRTGISGFGW